MQSINAGTSSDKSFPHSNEARDQPHKKLHLAFSAAEARLHAQFFQKRLLQMWCIWRDSFRSFRGHISAQFSTDQVGVNLGPSLECNSLGHYQRNVRTVARKLYTERLLATLLHRADTQDLQIFLMGFDAGESYSEWATANKQHNVHSESASWLTSDVEREILETLYAISVESGQTSVAMPAAIAGVIRSDE